jgi:hypothetical protein
LEACALRSFDVNGHFGENELTLRQCKSLAKDVLAAGSPKSREGVTIPHGLPQSPRQPRAPARSSGERAITRVTSDGLRLEARWLEPDGAERAVALCHPHPLYGGTMHHAVIVTFARALAKLPVACVR